MATDGQMLKARVMATQHTATPAESRRSARRNARHDARKSANAERAAARAERSSARETRAALRAKRPAVRQAERDAATKRASGERHQQQQKANAQQKATGHQVGVAQRDRSNAMARDAVAQARVSRSSAAALSRAASDRDQPGESAKTAAGREGLRARKTPPGYKMVFGRLVRA